MTGDPNPFEAPQVQPEKPLSATSMTGFTKKVKIAMAAFVLIGAMVIGVDYGFMMNNGGGFFVIFGPLVIFLVMTIWTFVIATRHSTMSEASRVVIGVLLAIVAPAACYFGLCITCMPATAAVGAGWELYGQERTLLSSVVGSSITFILVAGISAILYLLLSLFQGRRET